MIIKQEIEWHTEPLPPIKSTEKQLFFICYQSKYSKKIKSAVFERFQHKKYSEVYENVAGGYVFSSTEMTKIIKAWAYYEHPVKEEEKKEKVPEFYVAYDGTAVIGVVTREGKVVLDLRGKMYPKEIIRLTSQHTSSCICVMDENMRIGKEEEPEEILKNGREIYAREITHLLPALSLNLAKLKKREELEDA